MASSIPLHTKLKPKSLHDLVLSDADVAKVIEFLRVVPDPESLRFGMLLGSTGIGKTELVRLASLDLQLDVAWVYTSSFSPELVRRAAMTKSVTGKRKIIVFDEFDGLNASDVQYIKFPGITIVCISRVGRGRAVNQIPRSCEVLKIDTPSDDKISDVLSAAGATRGEANLIASRVKGDIRAALTALESGFHTRADNLADGLDLARDALCGNVQVGDIFRAQDHTAVSAVFENYTKRLDSAVSEAFSVGDVLGNTDFSVLGVATAATKPDRLACPTLQKFGTVWSVASTASAKAGNIRKVAGCRGSLGRTRLDFGDMGILRSCVCKLVETKDYAAIAELARNAGLDDAGLLALMRLFKTKYTLSVHSNVKKHL